MSNAAARGSARTRTSPHSLHGVHNHRQEPASKPPRATGALGRSAQASVIGIFVILLCLALEAARVILVPVSAAFVIGMMLGPVAKRASDWRVPSVVTAIGLWLSVVAVFYLLVSLFSGPALDLIGRAPEIGGAIESKLRALEQPLSAWPSLRNVIIASPNSGVDIANLLKSAVAIVTPAIGELVIFFATLFFFLLVRPQLRNGLIFYFKSRDSRLRAIRVMNEIERHLTGYLGIVTVINMFVGVVGGLIAFFVGLPNPLAWGLLGFILNYIPYVGALTMEIALLLFGLVTFSSLSHAFVAPLLYLALAIFEGQFLTPAILGQRLPLNSLTVFLSVVFWTWLWGPAGTFLATPLVITAFAIIEHAPGIEEPEPG